MPVGSLTGQCFYTPFDLLAAHLSQPPSCTPLGYISLKSGLHWICFQQSSLLLLFTSFTSLSLAPSISLVSSIFPFTITLSLSLQPRYIALRLYLIVEAEPFTGCWSLVEKGVGRNREERERGKERQIEGEGSLQKELMHSGAASPAASASISSQMSKDDV